MSDFHGFYVESGETIRLKTAGKYCDRDIYVSGIGGEENVETRPMATSLIRRGLGYIDTGIDGANSDLTIEVQYELETVPTGYWYLIRAYVNESTNATRILYNKNTATYCCLNSIPSSSLSITQTRYANVVYTDTLKAESSTSFSYTTNGVKTTKARSNGEELVGKNLLLFSDSTTDDGVVAKVYYLKIYDGTLLVRDYVPYIRSNGECGLYDNVTKRFFGNSGSGTFEADVIDVSGGASEDLDEVLTEQEEIVSDLLEAIAQKSAGSGTAETWTFTLMDDTVVTKEVYVGD